MMNNSSDLEPENSLTAVKSANRLKNILVMLVAIVLTLALMLGGGTSNRSAILTAMAKSSIPLDVAMTNHKPTLLEFYANWCTSCQAMAPDLQKLEEKYADLVNFVMLNVDNSKWLPEIVKYKVDGIPHFIFMDHQGIAITEAIGELPTTVIETNLEALVENKSLPNNSSKGKVSNFNSAFNSTESKPTDPRSHSGQVVN